MVCHSGHRAGIQVELGDSRSPIRVEDRFHGNDIFIISCWMRQHHVFQLTARDTRVSTLSIWFSQDEGLHGREAHREIVDYIQGKSHTETIRLLCRVFYLRQNDLQYEFLAGNLLYSSANLMCERRQYWYGRNSPNGR